MIFIFNLYMFRIPGCDTYAIPEISNGTSGFSLPYPAHLPLRLPVEGPSGVPGLDLDAPLPEVVGHLLLAQVRKRVEVFQELLQSYIDNFRPLYVLQNN